ncbi:MAG: RHS repeat-associated core domain-containing protein [Planctomycetaceae bacterium]|nr:RHS repeat-associated core domain-containing protein [Planctomycetaceae bacterium]MCB9951652.1 RHS repeat-associated core domain-containing protein [Planctomycetaceae bacterium]
MGSPKKRVQYRYDSVGNRSLMIDPDGGRTTYAYDALSRLTSLVNPQGERTTYAYDAAGRRTVKKLANGTRASFTYDAASRLTTLANLKSDNTVISKFDYQYDAVGNRKSVVEADGSRVTWLYDNTYQLTGEHRTGTTPYRNTFTYDSRGNRTLKNEGGTRTTYAYDAANQLQTAKTTGGTTTYTFDANGNQQLVEAPSGDRTTNTWDYENRTTLVQLPSGIRNTMAYEPDGLRVKLEESTGTKKFIWDDRKAYLAETDANDDTTVVYTQEPILFGNLVSQRRSSTTNWYHYDAPASTRALSNSGEAVTDTFLYNATGGCLVASGTTLTPFRFVGAIGYYLNTDSQSYYVRSRTYVLAAARWSSVDPLGFVDGANLYRYVSNSYVNAQDPTGMTGKCTVKTFTTITRQGCALYDTAGTSFLPDKPGVYGARFSVYAEFATPCCNCCEIRQYTRGGIKIRIGDGQSSDSTHERREDCIRVTQKAGDFEIVRTICYGHRTGDNAPANGENPRNDKYCPDRESGCKYLSYDLPGVADMDKTLKEIAAINTTIQIEIDLIMDVEVIDVCNGDELVSALSTRIRCTGNPTNGMARVKYPKQSDDCARD